MAIIKEINFTDFRNAFRDMGRQDQFSCGGLECLFDYLVEYSDDTGDDVSLDVISLCCEYAESDYEELIRDCDIDVSDCENKWEQMDAVQEYLEQNTAIVGEPWRGMFVYARF